jgi:uncharacterized cofD-like protein
MQGNSTRKKIVCIGGGTGVSVVLSGLKKYPVDLTAIVSMFDSAGSSGKLRDDLRILPPGDVRQCLLILAGNKEIAELCNFRFEKGFLKGHSFGNLLIAAAENYSGSFAKAIEKVSRILEIKGKVIPVTLEHSDIKVLLKNGQELANEDAIVNCFNLSEIGIKKIFLEPEVSANKQAIKAIKQADLIIIGPGKFYTSLLPNFLVKGIKEAIIKSRAKKMFICNLMTQAGNTDGLRVEDFVSILEDYLDKNIFNYIIFNTGGLKGKALKEVKEAFPRADFVKYDKGLLKDKKFFAFDLLDKKVRKINPNDNFVTGANKRTMVLHDSNKLARIILKLLK